MRIQISNVLDPVNVTYDDREAQLTAVVNCTTRRGTFDEYEVDNMLRAIDCAPDTDNALLSLTEVLEDDFGPIWAFKVALIIDREYAKLSELVYGTTTP